MAEAKIVFERELPRGKFYIYQETPAFPFIRVKQTHSAIALNEAEIAEEENEADAIIGQSRIPKIILTADCLPILLLGEKSHSFVHAGWRGLHNHILQNDLIKKIEPIYAFIGPHISEKYYEVQSEFKEYFPSSDVFHEKEGKIYFSLLKMAKKQLESFYPNIKIEDSGECTFENERFQSYRRNQTIKRNWNVYIP